MVILKQQKKRKTPDEKQRGTDQKEDFIPSEIIQRTPGVKDPLFNGGL